MLSDFVLALHEICTDEEFAELILKKAKKIKTPISDNIKNQIKNFYKNHNLSQVFLLTHSKNLVYNNFTLGRNYIVDGGLSLIDYDNLEKKLREVGLSKIITKVLFVEGKTENEILESIFSPYNIKVRSLGGCGEVIETYKRYLIMKEHIRDVQFCFLIDRDTRSDSDINTLRNRDRGFFDEHFIIMERHEIENYFLEAKMFHKLYTKHNSSFSQINVPSEVEIEDRIKSVATQKKEQVLRKKLQTVNQQSLSALKVAISNRTLPVDNQADYEAYIDSTFDITALNSTISRVKNNYQSLSEINSNWDQEWKKLCDGKAVFFEYLSKVSNDLQIQSKRARLELEEIGLDSGEFEISDIVQKIFNILK
jgi:hypothetical protein